MLAIVETTTWIPTTLIQSPRLPLIVSWELPSTTTTLPVGPLLPFSIFFAKCIAGDDFGRRYNPSSFDSHSDTISAFADPGLAGDHYPAWSADRKIPMSSEEIEDIFLDLTQKFGFQHDSMRNMVRLPHNVNLDRNFSHHGQVRLPHAPPRLPRLPHDPESALLTLHADYIGGANANYRKWYFAAQLNL